MEIKQNFSVQNLSLEHIPAMTELFNLAFATQLNPEVVRWKYFNNPAGKAIWVGIFSESKELIGSGAMVAELLTVLGEIKKVYKCTDLMIHPSFQGKGLASLINKSLRQQVYDENLAFSYTLCSKNASSNFIKNGWVPICGLTNYFKPRILLQFSAVFLAKPNVNIREVKEINNQFDNYKFTQHPSKIALTKSVEFLKWRIQNPNFDYTIIGHFTHEKLNGYLIYSQGTNGIINLLDIDAENDNSSTIKQLLNSLERKVAHLPVKGIVAIGIDSSRFITTLKAHYYFNNPFKKGPLQSTIDLNVLTKEPTSTWLASPLTWEVTGLMYDDV